MKISKSILTAVIAGTAIVSITTSCEKIDFENIKSTNEKNTERTVSGDVEQPTHLNETYLDCPACGLG